MGYFDSLIDFKTNTDGKIIYYPTGFWRKGFVVPSLEKKKEIQRAATRIYKICFFLIFIGVTGAGVSFILSPGGWSWVVGAVTLMMLIGVVVWCQRSLRNLAQGLVQSSVKTTILESYANSAQSMSFIALVVLAIMSGCMVFTALQIAISPQYYPWLFRPLGIFAVIFGGLASIVFFYMIIVKIKSTLRK